MQKDYIWNPNTCICDNNKYLESIIDTSVTEYDTIATNVTITVSINCHGKKVRGNKWKDIKWKIKKTILFWW